MFLGTFSTYGQKTSNSVAGEKEPMISIEMSSTSSSDDGTSVNERNAGKIEYSMSTNNSDSPGSGSNRQNVDPAIVEEQFSMKYIDSSNIKNRAFRKEH